MGQACGSEEYQSEKICIEYFTDIHGRAEPLRCLLSHAQIEWEEKGVNMAGWVWRKTTKNTGEMGQLPIIHYQGKDMQQFGAVLRAIGVEKGYYNASDWRQAAKIDWIIDTWGELIGATANIGFSMASAASKQEKYAELCEQKWRPMLAHLEK